MCDDFLITVAYISDTVKAAFEWAERNPGCGISLQSVEKLPGFGHNLATLTATAADRAGQLESELGVKIDFNFLK
jgi:hypothetical protein